MNKKTKNKLKKIITTFVVILILSLSISWIVKYNNTKEFRQGLNQAEQFAQEKNQGKDFSRFEPFYGPNTVDEPLDTPDDFTEILQNNQ